MTQEEIYILSGELSNEEVAYLVCSHLEHTRDAEMGWKIDCEDRIFIGKVECIAKVL